MKKIYSKIDPAKLLHIAVFKDEISMENREDISEDSEYLQFASIPIEKGKNFAPHYHLFQERSITATQECWIIIHGKIQVSYYDTDT